MRTVRRTKARRRTVSLAMLAGLVIAVAVPASAATLAGTPAKHHRVGHASTGAEPETSSKPETSSSTDVRLGPAVKYVRGADGTIRQSR